MPRLRVLIACALAPLLLWALLPVPSDGASPAQLQDKIATLRGKVADKKGTERVLSSDITAYSSRIARLEGRIGGLQRRQADLQADLDRKRAELARIQERLRAERARLARLRARLVVTRRMLATRLREIYMAEKPDALSVVLNADGFAELLERGEFIRRIADQDRRIVIIVREAKADAQATEARLDRLERRQQRLTLLVMRRRDQVADVKQQLIGTKVGMERTRAGKSRALRKVRAERSELQEDLQAMEAQQARIQARLAQTTGGGGGMVTRGSGQLIVPVNGAFTSPFGQRWGRLHAGIDIAAPTGTPIRAADGGRVAIAGWVGGYGQYTCIQHGGGMSTCYGHQSRIAVSVGQSVSKGQLIGAVGNTGNSTGAHLHFEVRINGSPVDPMGYL